jgi:hypothetical protein
VTAIDGRPTVAKRKARNYGAEPDDILQNGKRVRVRFKFPFLVISGFFLAPAREILFREAVANEMCEPMGMVVSHDRDVCLRRRAYMS